MTKTAILEKKLNLTKQLVRLKAQEDLEIFVPYVTPDFEKPVHLRPITEKLEEIKQGKVKKLLISAPPQHGKSELILHFIAYYLKDNPKRRVAYSSFNSQETVNRSVKAQDYCKAVGLQSDDRFDNKKEWKTLEGGGITAKSVKEGSVGRSVDLWIIDDPYGGIQDAFSEKHRKMLKDWWEGTVKTRMMNDTSIIVMHTRWNVDDLQGQLEGKGFETVRIPAIREVEGKEVALFPKLKSLELLQKKREENPQFFEANYQQRPLLELGNQFKRVANIENNTDYEARIFSIDMAYTKNDSSDYTVLLELHKKGENIYVHDMYRGKYKIDEIEQLIKDVVGENEMLVEDNGIQKAINENLVRNTKAWILKRKVTSSKLVRAMNAIKMWNSNKIKLNEAEWNKDLQKEIYKFTGNKDGHDDIVDALSLGVNFLREYY